MASQPAGSSAPSGGPPSSQPAATPVPPPPKPSLTDAEISARSTKHAAWVAAGAAILAAILALGGTLWGSHMAADSASRTVAQQVSGETEKSRAEFLRGQRQVLYSQIIADERKLFDMENDAEWRNYKERSRAVEKMRLQYRQLEMRTPTTEIIASGEAGDQLAKLVDIHNKRIVGMVRPRAVPPQQDLRDQRELTLSAFFRAARKDMGAE